MLKDAETALLAERFAPARPAQLFDTGHALLKHTPSKQLEPRVAAAAKAPALMVTRAKSQHEVQRVALPRHARIEAKPADPSAKTEEKKRAREELAAPAHSTQVPQARPESFDVPVVASPPQVPAPFEPLLARMSEDPSLRVALMPGAARVSVDTGDAGRVNVQVRINDGVAELRATGPGAAVFEQRQNELRVALAQEGLAMGHFDLTQSGHHGHEQREPIERESFAPRPSARPTEDTNHDGHLHVKV